MSRYTVGFKISAVKEFQALPEHIKPQIQRRIESLKETSFPAGAKRLSGHPGFRIRSGDYRIVYVVAEEAKRITVIAVGKRGDIYRDL